MEPSSFSASRPDRPLDWTAVDDALTDLAPDDVAQAIRAQLSHTSDVAPDQAQAFAALVRRWRAESVPAARVTRSRPRPLLRRAGIGGIIGVVLLATWWVRPGLQAWRWSREASSDVGRTYTTLPRQHATITLADGSRVYIAPGTRLTVSTGFGQMSRTIVLRGEAVFEVAPSSHAPFLVQAGAVTTRVLGTTFGVRAYAGEEVRIAVTEGKVAAGGLGVPVTLVAGHVAYLTDSTARVVTDDAADLYTLWAQGTLAFKKTPVPDMLATLGRWCGYEFRLADSSSALAAERVTAEFKTDAPAETMQALKTLLRVRMTFDGSIVTLHPLTARDDRPATRESRERRGPRLDSVPYSSSTEFGK